jgi:hypothetical protein
VRAFFIMFVILLLLIVIATLATERKRTLNTLHPSSPGRPQKARTQDESSVFNLSTVARDPETNLLSCGTQADGTS